MRMEQAMPSLEPPTDRRRYRLDAPGLLEISVVDMLGRVVLADAVEAAGLEGTHDLDLRGVSVGQYLVRVQAGDRLVTRRVAIGE